jgi:FkbM family methyltransferase
VRSLPNIRGRGRLALALNAALLKAGADPHAVARMAAGHSLHVDSRVQNHCWFLFLGANNDQYIRALLRCLRPDGAALDVGANLGSVTVPLALAAKPVRGRVVAIEPFPGNAAWLRRNLKLNQVEDVVTLFEIGLSSEARQARLLLREDFARGAGVGTASVAEEVADARFEQVAIELRTLDELWPSIGNPRLDVIKVDIDGHEDRFLEGGRQTIAANRPAILTEVCRWFYRQRGLDFNRLIPELLPPSYRFFSSSLTEFKDLSACPDGDVLLVPEEKVAWLRA